jgi:hypothetical protein
MKKILLCLICIAVFSCEKPFTERPEEVKNSLTVNVQDGILRFESMEDFLSSTEQIGSMSTKDYTEWSKNKGFESRMMEYLKEVSLDSIVDSQLRPNGSLIKNATGGYYHLNSINSNYARVTNKDGLVIIEGSTYMFSYDEIKKIDSISNESFRTLLSVNDKKEYKKYGIEASEVVSVSKVDPKARTTDGVVVERKVQQGSDISGDPFWDWYLDATFEIKGYSIPGCIICNPGPPYGRYTATLEVFYYADGLFQKTKEIPQLFKMDWTFVRHHPPLAPGFGETITGAYEESGVKTVFRTISDGGEILRY